MKKSSRNPKTPTLKQQRMTAKEADAIRQVQELQKQTGLTLDQIQMIGQACEQIIKDPTLWPEFAEMVGEDPKSPVDLQTIGMWITMARAADVAESKGQE